MIIFSFSQLTRWIILLLTTLKGDSATSDENSDLHSVWNTKSTKSDGEWEQFLFYCALLVSSGHQLHTSHRYGRFKRLRSRMLMVTILKQPSDSATFRQFHNFLPYPDPTETLSQIKDISWFLQIIIWPLKGTSCLKGGPREERSPPLHNFLTNCLLVTSQTLGSEKGPLLFSWVTRPPPWWPSDRSRLRSIAGERRRSSVGWCGAGLREE